MSKTIKQSLVILIVLLVISLGMVFLTFLQKQALQKSNEHLNGQIAQYEENERGLTQKITRLEGEVRAAQEGLAKKNREAEDLARELRDAKSDSARIARDMERVEKQRGELDARISTMRRERDELMSKLAKAQEAASQVKEKVVEKIVYRDRPVEQTAAPAVVSAPSEEGQPTFIVENHANEEYWAGVMREKAALELELKDVKNKLNQKSLEVEELKKSNSDLEISLGRLKNEREAIIRKIKYGEDLADSLSVELARARNEQKVVQDRASKLGDENLGLRTEIKQLTSTKISLEKSIARLTDEKSQIEKRLVETENIIQSRIDEIWQIKKDIDSRFQMNNGSSEVELAPIVVTNTAPARQVSRPVAAAKTGSVVSVNEGNNFVIVDLGEGDGIRVGDQLKVYRGANQIGVVSVIQVRKDISAADIKQRTTAFQPGDTVK